MSAPGYLERRRAAGASGGPAAGPAMTTLSAVAARTASVIRCIALGYIVAQVVIWHAFFAADPRRLAGPAVAVLCAAAVVGYLRWRRPGWQVASIDTGVQVALALGAGWCVPPAMRGDTSSWLYIALASQLIVPAWFAPTAVFAPLALASGTAYWASAVIYPAPGSAPNSPAASGEFLAAVAAVAWCALRLIRRRAIAADVALAHADRDSRAQYVALSRNTERREHERLLHDTVLNTLTALARPGGSDAAQVMARCQHDVSLMEHALGETGDLDGSAREPDGGLLIGIEAVASEMRARGLVVHLEVAPLGSNPLSDGSLSAVPVPVAAAIAHAVREGLANVASHAGTGEAWVDVRPGATTVERGGVEVTVRDAGAGFDPARIDPARLGLRRSVVERVADWGGRVSIRSAPGEGTVVSLRWTWSADSGEQGVADGGRDRGRPW